MILFLLLNMCFNLNAETKYSCESYMGLYILNSQEIHMTNNYVWVYLLSCIFLFCPSSF